MDADDDILLTTRAGGPPPPPPPGMGEVLRSHNMVRVELGNVVNQVHELRNHAMLLEHQLAAEQQARAQMMEEKRQSAAAMFQASFMGSGVTPFVATIANVAPDLSMDANAQTKRDGTAPSEQVAKKQIVERIVESFRPADEAAARSRQVDRDIAAAASAPAPPAPPPVTYEPKGEIMPYTHANPEVQEAIARLVSVMSRKRAVDPGIAEATIAADQSGKATVAKKTRYTTMSRFNAAALMRRRAARGERKSERVARELAIEEAANFLSPKAKTTPTPKTPTPRTPTPKVPKTPRKTRVTTNIVKMTPGRRTAAA